MIHALFQSTRPMRGATDEVLNVLDAAVISIHAPHAGRDLRYTGTCRDGLNISIHAPHAGRDRGAPRWLPVMDSFQSTRPMRGATAEIVFAEHHRRISIHAPHAGRDNTFHLTEAVIGISIHAPHAGRDWFSVW